MWTCCSTAQIVCPCLVSEKEPRKEQFLNAQDCARVAEPYPLSFVAENTENPTRVAEGNFRDSRADLRAIATPQNAHPVDLKKLLVMRTKFSDLKASSSHRKSNSFLPSRDTSAVALESLLLVSPTPSSERENLFNRVLSELTCHSTVGVIRLYVNQEQPVYKLGLLHFIRFGLEVIFKSFGVRVLKTDDERIFLVSTSSASVLKATLAALRFCTTFSNNYNSLQVYLSAGIDTGEILLVPEDFYGDPVNTASKLGEDNACAGEVSVSRRSLADAAGSSVEFLGKIDIEFRTVSISGVEIEYGQLSTVSEELFHRYISDLPLPSPEDVHHYARFALMSPLARSVALRCIELLPLQLLNASYRHLSVRRVECELSRRVTLLQSDLSGFTRLTRKYGIMHFLSLVMRCRYFYAECLDRYGGKILKYDGDNVITIFDSPVEAAFLVSALVRKINAYNKQLDEDYQVRIKFGMAVGKVLIASKDIIGEAWDECCTLGEDLAKVGEVLVTKQVRGELLADPQFSEQLDSVSFDERPGVPLDKRTLHFYNMRFS
mmetsp:Transcript_18235/g.43626  ORF Transcript_18235/g.43626 Transcript_18235/m.43626 type:complete len:548 (-) Transcript_18235:175-1818(-)